MSKEGGSGVGGVEGEGVSGMEFRMIKGRKELSKRGYVLWGRIGVGAWVREWEE